VVDGALALVVEWVWLVRAVRKYLVWLQAPGARPTTGRVELAATSKKKAPSLVLGATVIHNPLLLAPLDVPLYPSTRRESLCLLDAIGIPF
jgi:hypothetical protein